MDAYLFLNTAQRCQFIIPKCPCQNIFILILGTFRISTSGCGKIPFILSYYFVFELEIRAKQYANDKTYITE